MQLQTFTLQELAFLEKESYQNIFNAKKRGEYIEIAVRSGIGKNVRISTRYLSRRMSKIILSLMQERLLDGILAEDQKAAVKATERKRTQKLSSHEKQYEKNPHA